MYSLHVTDLADLTGNYLLIFRIEEQTKKIYILRFFYGAQDYLSQL
jgi:hypothetical protein